MKMVRSMHRHTIYDLSLDSRCTLHRLHKCTCSMPVSRGDHVCTVYCTAEHRLAAPLSSFFRENRKFIRVTRRHAAHGWRMHLSFFYAAALVIAALLLAA